MTTRDLRSYFSLKVKENNKEAQSMKVNSTPDLVKSSEHVTLADAESGRLGNGRCLHPM